MRCPRLKKKQGVRGTEHTLSSPPGMPRGSKSKKLGLRRDVYVIQRNRGPALDQYRWFQCDGERPDHWINRGTPAVRKLLAMKSTVLVIVAALALFVAPALSATVQIAANKAKDFVAVSPLQ
jgi:hypothetical protein